MPISWKQLKESGFPLDDYDKDISIGEHELIVDGACYSKSSQGGSGIHIFARHWETGKKYWCYVHYLADHSSYVAAKAVSEGRRIRILVELGRNGRGLVRAVNESVLS